MNVGFSNLASLKAQLLSANLQTNTAFDTRLVAIGLGVAKSFERYCNAEFTYQQGILEVFQADRPFWYTRRTPVSIFTKVELRYFRSDSWTDISGQPLATDEEKGMIDFGYTLGRSPMQVRVTYNGGFFWEQLEPTDPGYPTAVPVDISANSAGIDPTKFYLPADLLFAWQMQCRKVWEAIDKIGNQIVNVGSNARNPAEVMAGLELIPEVQGILATYKRFQLT